MDTKDPKPSPAHALFLKLSLNGRFGFMLLVCFGLLGTCSNAARGVQSPAPLAVIIMTVLSWAILRIVGEGIEAFTLLQAISKHKNEQNKKDKKGDGGSGGPASPA